MRQKNKNKSKWNETILVPNEIKAYLLSVYVYGHLYKCTYTPAVWFSIRLSPNTVEWLSGTGLEELFQKDRLQLQQIASSVFFEGS